MTQKKINGRLILKEIKLSEIYQKTIRKGSNSSDRIHMPKGMAGTKVIIIIDPEQEDV